VGNFGAATNYSYSSRPTFTSPWSASSFTMQNQSGFVVSTGHDTRLLGSRFDVGGPFFLKKEETSYAPWIASGNRYRGPVLVGAADSISGYPDWSDTSQLDAKGATALSRAMPNQPHSQMVVAVGELASDGVPKMFGSGLLKAKTAFLRGSGDEYLNYEFGWRPLVKDLKEFASSVINAHQHIDGYVKQSRRKLRRAYTYKPSRTTSTLSRTFSGCHPTVASATGWRDAVQTTSYRCWFSGAFVYYVPMGNDQWSRMRRYQGYARKLFGLELTPEVVWELAPWSWAADWFTNVGDVMNNVSSLGSDGMVMQYGYVCEESISSLSITQKATLDGAGSGTTTAMHTKCVKQRRPANPYGFGVEEASLSARQLAIISALGFTRGHRR